MSDQQRPPIETPPNLPRGGSSVERPGARPGAWVTLHLHYPSGQERAVLGWLVGSELGQYKLTKFVTEKDANDGVQQGYERTIHNGAWLINPMYVWMIEHEQEAPAPGFRPIQF